MPPEVGEALSLTRDVDGFDRASFARETGATGRMMADIDAYREMLDLWNGRINLVGPSALSAFWRRHAYDSAQLLALAPKARIWTDVGAGAGFPGVILGILLRETPGAAVHLVDSMAKRTRFLSEVAQKLDLPVTIHTGRAEALDPPRGVEVVTARACARMQVLLGYVRSCLDAGATGLFLKGQDVEQELTEARRSWTFQAMLHPSRSDPSGRIVRIERLARV